MRIVFVIHELVYGGAETQLISLSRELSLRGHAVSIFLVRGTNLRAHELTGYDISVVSGGSRHRFDVLALWRLRRHIRTFRPDIIQGFLFGGDFYARIAGAGTGIPVINSERSHGYIVPLKQKLAMLFANRLVSGVVANSHAGAAFARQRFRLPPERVHTVWNGIDISRIETKFDGDETGYREQFFERADVSVACLVGSIKPAKDYLLALAVADHLTAVSPKWRVLFIGDSLRFAGADYKTRVFAEYERRRLTGRAAFAGESHDVIRILRKCDVLFSTSRYEGFPNVVLEAMACGTPVVSTEYSDIRAILPFDWQVIHDRSPEAISNAILRANRERASVAQRQREWIKSHADIATIANEWERVYASYIEKTHNGPSLDEG